MKKVLLAGAVVAIWTMAAHAQGADTARIRAAFLKLIDRPRVALSPHSRPRPDSGFYHAEHFTYASEAAERVPGIFLKAAASKDRRPAIIILHGSGAKKEEQLGLMRTLADRGF